MAKQKVKMREVMDAFFKYQTAKSGRHKTDNGHYYYGGDLIATITKTKFIINPNKHRWPGGLFHGNYAMQLLSKYLIDNKITDEGPWRNGWPFVGNDGWGYVCKSMLFDFPLIINRRTKKIINKIDHNYVINKFKLARNIYNINKIYECANHFNIILPENIINKKKDMLCKQICTDSHMPMNMEVLFKLKTNDTDIINIKGAIKDRISKCKNFYRIEEIRKAIDNYFKDDAELLSELKPKYVELRFDQELGVKI